MKEILYTEDRELTINGFIKELQSLAPKYRNMPVKIMARNGLIFTPTAKLMLKDNYVFGDVIGILITCE